MKNERVYDYELTKLISKLPFEIGEDELISISLSISRSVDKKITSHINDFKKKNNLKLSRLQKIDVHNYILGLDEWKIDNVLPIETAIIDDKDILTSIKLINEGIERNMEKVIGTIKSRFYREHDPQQNLSDYQEIIKEYEDDKNQLLIIKENQTEEGSIDKIKSIIDQEYDNLANYHYLGIIFENSNWKTISDIAIHCENFKREYNFRVFNSKSQKKIKELNIFVENHSDINNTPNIKDKIKGFYGGVSYGFQFNDLLISKNDNTKILIMQKIELDETIIPCPDCMKEIARGNSYPKLLQRSFECQNSSCPSRSKIGRGKRYDYFNVKRNLYLKLRDPMDFIDHKLSKDFRRDIYEDKSKVFDMLIKFYSWSGDTIKYVSDEDLPKSQETFNRKINFSKFSEYNISKTEELPIVSMLKEIIKNISIVKKEPNNIIRRKNFSIYLGNSSNILENINEKISGVITSPPYYNAREYSQWPTLICYLIDMAINAKSVFEKMQDETYYFYNIGDIVGSDNVFVSSQMSKRRLMLGFYSILVFEMVNYKLIENIIWDKGEVQSKRNSTQNLFPSYVKPINCYEHILIFGKNINEINVSEKIVYIDTVKKINSKGQNIIGHTAPYPERLVELIFPYLQKEKGSLLDPYLGSGTTVISGYKNGYSTVGIEYNNDYFELSAKRIIESTDS